MLEYRPLVPLYYTAMTVVEWLRQATGQLQISKVSTARLDALILLEDVLDVDRAWLIAEPGMEIVPEKLTRLKKLLKQRTMHVPLAYVRGKTEFYGREFVITPAVLEPRPESETMIDLLKDLLNSQSLASMKHKPLCVADVGAGSGALGITTALEVPNCQVELLEIDKKAAEIAKVNVDKFTLQLPVLHSDLISGSSQDYDILLCNLPYVPDDYLINQAATHEPKRAIFGGRDGLDLYRKLFKQITKREKRPLFLLLEAFPPQHTKLQSIAAESGYKLVTTDDFIQAYKRIQ